MPLPSGTWSIATIEVALRNGEIYILTLVVCYQMVQSVLKISFVLAKKGGIGGGG